MASKRNARIDFKGFLDFANDLDNLGETYLKKAVANSMQKTKDYLNNETLKAMDSSKYNFEPGGESIKELFKVEEMPIEWDGYICKAFVGVDLSKAPQTLILAIKGSPRQSPDRNLYNAVYGAQTKKKIMEMQEQAFNKVLERVVQNEK